MLLSAIFVFLTLVAGSNPLSQHVGAISIQLPDTLLVKGILTLNYDLSPPIKLTSLLCELHDSLDHITRTFLDPGFNNNTSSDSNLTDNRILDNSLLTYDFLTRAKTLSQQFSSLNQMNYFNSHSCSSLQTARRRRRRGLINAGGQLLKFLFGVTTEDEINEVKSNTRKLAKSVSVILEEDNINIKIINENFNHIKGSLHNTNWNLLRLNIYVHLNRIEQAISELRLHAILVDNALAMAADNDLHPSLLPFAKFKDIASQAARDLKLFPFFETTFENYYHYIKLCECKVSGTFAITVDIPFTDAIIYRSYVLVPFPNSLHMNDNDNKTSKYVKLADDETTYFISSTSYFSFSPLAVDNYCKNSYHLRACYNTHIRRIDDSCGINLIMNNESFTCNYTTISPTTITPKPIILKISSLVIINFGKPRTSVTVKCTNNSRTFIANDILIISHSCDLLTDLIQIVGKAQRVGAYHLDTNLGIESITMNAMSAPSEINLVQLNPHPDKSVADKPTMVVTVFFAFLLFALLIFTLSFTYALRRIPVRRRMSIVPVDDYTATNSDEARITAPTLELGDAIINQT